MEKIDTCGGVYDDGVTEIRKRWGLAQERHTIWASISLLGPVSPLSPHIFKWIYAVQRCHAETFFTWAFWVYFFFSSSVSSSVSMSSSFSSVAFSSFSFSLSVFDFFSAAFSGFFSFRIFFVDSKSDSTPSSSFF